MKLDNVKIAWSEFWHLLGVFRVSAVCVLNDATDFIKLTNVF